MPFRCRDAYILCQPVFLQDRVHHKNRTMKASLKPQQLRKTYTPDQLKDYSEKISEHRKAIIGQKRAVQALRFGLGNRAPGFNVYVSVPSRGENKIDLIRHFLEELAEKSSAPSDWCYVNNFADPHCPNALQLPAGKAGELKKDIEQFLDEAQRALVKTFESDEYAEKQDAIRKEAGKKQQLIFNELNEKAQRENFLLKTTPMEILAIPKKEDKPITDEQFQQMSKEERSEILAKQRAFQDLLRIAMRQSRELEKEATHQLFELEQQAALYAIEDLLQELMERYRQIEEVPEYLEDMKNDILENLALFLQEEQESANIGIRLQRSALYQRYEVNVLVDNSKLEKAPITVELNPSFNNLFGKIERESVMGTLVTNFSLIRSGALHEANGGFLILPLDDLLREPFSWDTLKRALRNRRIEIEDPTERMGFISAKSLKPEPIPLNLQVILIGQQRLFYLLHQFDDDFHDLFKVKAEFDVVMPASQENIADLCRFVNSLHESEKILPVDKTALVKILEHGHRLAEHQEKLSSQLDEITDTLREANYYAGKESAATITDQHINQAIREKEYRSDLIHEKIKELIEQKIIVIDMEGEKTGQVNGLAVFDLGDVAFGRPNRITASVSVGLQGIVDIEREVELGDPVHSKGVMILSGFLFDKFGKDKPLNLSARLVFEQSYSGIAGDSASSAEVYAILSALSGLPIRQGVAVTGSVNQKGQVQAVGGINQKIEGFFEVCRQQGLTGEQGVLLPASNVRHLMLKEEVIEAVSQGQFHLWAVETIDEGIEILTGIQAGTTEWNAPEGTLEFEKDSVYDRVNRRLLQLTEAWQTYGRPKTEQGVSLSS